MRCVGDHHSPLLQHLKLDILWHLLPLALPARPAFSVSPAHYSQQGLSLISSPGGYLSRALLSPQFYPSQIGKVVGYTRNPSSEQAQALKATGVEVRASSADPEAYKGLDVFINAASIRSPEDWAVMDSHVKAAIDGGIKVFFPSEFGM